MTATLTVKKTTGYLGYYLSPLGFQRVIGYDCEAGEVICRQVDDVAGWHGEFRWAAEMDQIRREMN